MEHADAALNAFAKGDPFYSSLRDVSAFALQLRIPPLEIPTVGAFADQIVNGLYEQLREVVREAGFFHEDELQPIRESDRLGIRYADDEFDFRVTVEQGNITIFREGSRLDSFLQWFTAFMPSVDGVITTIQSILQADQGMPIAITKGTFTFMFLVHNLKDGDDEPVPNSTLMAKLVKRYPGVDGRITDFAAEGDEGTNGLAHGDQDIGRVDFKFSRWVDVGDARRSWWYSVEAPGNKRWSSLWFSFEYQGSSHTAPDGTRFDFSSEGFLNEWDVALYNFLRDTAIGGFMESLLEEYKFETAIQRVP